MKKIIVVGAGAAGLMAACAAADAGAQVTVLEHNEKAGKKIYITGKGRCNYSNACENEDFFANVLRNPKFLYSALYSYDSAAVTRFLQNNGCPTKEERGKRLFPASDRAFDVTDALVRHLKKHGGEILFHKEVSEIFVGTDGNAEGVILKDGRRILSDAVIVATGGKSYPSTGSTGDGCRMAKELGIDVKPMQPSLVPFTVREDWPLQLQGLALKNVAVSLEKAEQDTGTISTAGIAAAGNVTEIAAGADMAESSAAGKKKKSKKKRPVYEGFGELLFTHFGISGPLILSASCHTDFGTENAENGLRQPAQYLLHLDLKPALTMEELEARIERESSLAPKKELRNMLKTLLPERLAEIVARLYVQREEHPSAEGGENRPVYTLNEKERRDLAALLKDLVLTVTGTRGFAEAIVTRGGVSVKEINPSTMESRKVPGLYFAGEMIDVDAYTGGFNLQIAWSTGHLAGESAAASD